jgi:hypothetical protein
VEDRAGISILRTSQYMQRILCLIWRFGRRAEPGIHARTARLSSQGKGAIEVWKDCLAPPLNPNPRPTLCARGKRLLIDG